MSESKESLGRPMGSARHNQWRVGKASVSLVRPPIEPKRLSIAAQPQNLVVDAARSAFIVVDMQNDFCAKGGFLDYRGVDITPDQKPIAPIARIAPELRALGVPIVWLNWGVRTDLLNASPSLLHAHCPDGTGAGLGETIPGGKPILVEGGWGAAIVDGLVPDERDIRVTKYRYSGFWDTELDSILRNLGVTTLFFAGVNADQCVMSTLQDAMFLGYDCILVEDCVGTTSPEYCMQATLYNVKLLYGFVTDSAAIRHGIRGAGIKAAGSEGAGALG
jgi:nicotinamidase-related amidase